MHLHPFKLVQPQSVDEALEALAQANGESRLIAGGTALTPMMRLGLLRPERVISLHRVSTLDAINAHQGVLHLGAMVTMANLHRSPVVRNGWALLAETAGRVATPAIRSSATIGGNLAYAEAASDPAPALLCLEAQVQIAGPTGGRSLPLTRFFTGIYETALEPGELLVGVRVPPCPPGALHGHVKFCPRSAEDKPLVGVAALLSFDPHTARCREARLALAGAAPTAIRAARAESILTNDAIDERTIRAAADAAAEDADPLSDLMGSAVYRREMVRVWVRRLLTRLTEARARSASEV